MNLRYLSCLFLSSVILVPSLFGKDLVGLYNGTLYPVTAEVTFCQANSINKCVAKQDHTLQPGQFIAMTVPTYSDGRVSGARSYPSIVKATVLADQEPVWEGGKVGTKIVGMKVKRPAQSVERNMAELNIGSSGMKSISLIVIHANRTRHLINNIEHIKDLEIYSYRDGS